MHLRLSHRGSPGKHARRQRRNTITGGLGEVFVAMLEVERWRALSPAELSVLLKEVSGLFGGDAAAQALVERVSHIDRTMEAWEAALLSLIRIGDLEGSRCDLITFREHASGPFLVFVEVKATRGGRMDRFMISSAEWKFLSRKDIRSRCAIVCVTGAERGTIPAVEYLENPALLPEVSQRVLPTNYEFLLRPSKVLV